MASGSPSSLAQISATARIFSDPIVKEGWRCRARSAKSRADSERSSSPTEGERRGSGTESAGTGHLDSPATLRASRLVTRTRKRGQESSNTAASRAAASTRCSQLSKTSSISLARKASTSASTSDRADCSGTPTALATA